MESKDQVKVPRGATEKEMELLKRTFGENEPFLKSVRNLMLGLPTTKEERGLIKKTFTPELVAIFKRRLCPDLDSEAPIGQIQEVWIGAEQMVFGEHPDTIKQALAYKDQAIKMTRQALDLLENPEGPKPMVKYEPSMYMDDPLGINLLARNQFIKGIENNFVFIWLAANQKTPANSGSESEKGDGKGKPKKVGTNSNK